MNDPARPILHRTTVFALLLAALGAALAGSLAGAAPAAAHNVLRSSSPTDGAVLPTPPPDVQLVFDESVIALGTEVAVDGPAGDVSLAPVVVDGSTVTQPLPADLPAGAYTVQWRATSSDGHPVSGKLAFTADAASPAPAVPSTPSPTTPSETSAEPAPAPSPAAADGSGLSAGAWVAIGVGALAALGGGAAVLASKGRGPTRQD